MRLAVAFRHPRMDHLVNRGGDEFDGRVRHHDHRVKSHAFDAGEFQDQGGIQHGPPRVQLAHAEDRQADLQEMFQVGRVPGRPHADRPPNEQQRGSQRPRQQGPQAQPIEIEPRHQRQQQQAADALGHVHQRQSGKIVRRPIGQLQIIGLVVEHHRQHGVGEPARRHPGLAARQAPRPDRQEHQGIQTADGQRPGLRGRGQGFRPRPVAAADVVRQFAVQAIQDAQLQERRIAQRETDAREQPQRRRRHQPPLEHPRRHPQRHGGHVAPHEMAHQTDQRAFSGRGCRGRFRLGRKFRLEFRIVRPVGNGFESVGHLTPPPLRSSPQSMSARFPDRRAASADPRSGRRSPASTGKNLISAIPPPNLPGSGI